MDKKQRLRAPNFTNSESLLLCDIIDKYKHVIENKKTDGANLLQKQKAWMEVEKEFNSITTSYSRTLESLQQNYKNLKKKTKKLASSAKMDIPVDRITLVEKIEEFGTSSEGWREVADSTGLSEEICQNTFTALTKEAESQDKKIKKIIMSTGGGPPPKFEDDTLMEKVKGLVGPRIDGLYTIYDGDSSLMASQSGILPVEANNTEESSIIIGDEELTLTPKRDVQTQDSNVNNVEYFTNDRANLKRTPHHLLARSNKRKPEKVPVKQTVSEKFNSLASEKMELVAMQKEIVKLELIEAREKLEHNRLLRAMEIEDNKKKYEHNELMRKLELEGHSCNE